MEPVTGDLFTVRFADCHFNESVFSTLGGENKQLEKEIDWNILSLSRLDTRTNQCEQEVQKIIYMQNIANQLPDAFTSLPWVTKSHIQAVNAPIRVDVPVGQYDNANESRPYFKCGRPIGSKEKNSRKRKGANDRVDHNVKAIAQEEHKDITINKTLHEVLVPENDENEDISISYVSTGKSGSKITLLLTTVEAMQQDKDLEPKSVDKFRTPEGVKSVGYKWIFVREQNEKGEIVRYKARLVAQGFSQRPNIDYMVTYSPVVDAITFRYLINLPVHEKLDMRLMDVVTSYLYGSLDNEIFMKIPKGFKVPEAHKSSFRNSYTD
uniref:Reverse transcriptase Ty1/copia-type domain-containing protein n=1 Tax=Nicotiana tabacum TaxID=4097 RepID=A0A1S4CNE0_TOBAC|nr:PREDICTED: uncharacterized protein LOC107820660 [Nicotiana tabacum]